MQCSCSCLCLRLLCVDACIYMCAVAIRMYVRSHAKYLLICASRRRSGITNLETTSALSRDTLIRSIPSPSPRRDPTWPPAPPTFRSSFGISPHMRASVPCAATIIPYRACGSYRSHRRRWRRHPPPLRRRRRQVGMLQEGPLPPPPRASAWPRPGRPTWCRRPATRP